MEVEKKIELLREIELVNSIFFRAVVLFHSDSYDLDFNLIDRSDYKFNGHYLKIKRGPLDDNDYCKREQEAFIEMFIDPVVLKNEKYFLRSELKKLEEESWFKPLIS